MHAFANAGHVGGNLSCLDALMVLFHLNMMPHDRFILSKGHAAGALYVTLWSLGFLTDDDLKTFCQDNTKLPGHPSGFGIPKLQFPTGSLGHGPSLAAGLALASMRKKSGSHVFCLCSDGEWQEGSCWEALIFSMHHRLKNLTVLIDQNRLQGFGNTHDIVSCNDLQSRLQGFGANVICCDGHNPTLILDALKKDSDLPKVVLLNTIKGKGTLYEDKMESHYLPLTPENLEYSLSQIEKI